MTSTYDHRIIQGAESGSFLRRIDQLLQGEDDFYESVAEALGIADEPGHQRAPRLRLGAAAAAPAAPAAAARRGRAASPTASCCRRCRRRPRCSRPTAPTATSRRDVNPLGGEPKGDPALEPENLNLTPELMARIPASILRIGVEGETLLDALPRMRDAYCGDDRLPDRAPLLAPAADVAARDDRDRLAPRAAGDATRSARCCSRLIEVFQFERFLQKAYLGQKMFSIEGLDATVPMLDEIATLARQNGAEEVVIGMAHRGRLSVLAHNLGRSVESILAEFEGAKALDQVKAITAMPHSGTGDVKYHHGAEGLFDDPRRRPGEDPPVPEPEPPRVRRPGGHRRRPRRADRALGPEAAPQPARRGAGAAARRRRLPRPGRGRRDAQPAVARRLLDRRHDPPDHRQPGRLHHRPARRTARPRTPATWRRASTARSSTSTPTTSRPASPPSAWRWPTASSGAATSSST